MKKFKTFLYVFCLIVTIPQTKVYSQWIWQNPIPQGNRLWDIKFININTGWTCGEYGTMMKTVNGGINWNFISINPHPDFKSLYFINSETGFVSGNDTIKSYIYKTTNGGINFEIIFTANTSELPNIIFTDADNGWTAGESGKIYHSSDGGNNWSEQQSNIMGYISGITFPDYNTGYAVSMTGNVIKTTNKGINWVTVYTNSSENYSSVYFSNVNTGYLTGYYGIVKKTTNGGFNWFSVASTPFNLYVFDVKFINELTGWITDGTLYSSVIGIYKTTNGGASWSLQNCPTQTDEWILRLCITDSNNIYGAGDYGTIVKNSGTGNSWYWQTQGTTNQIRATSFINLNTGWAIANWPDKAKILKTTNSGNNWESINDIVIQQSAIKFINENTGICSGGTQNIYRTTNGGYNWYSVPTGANKVISCLYFTSNESVLAIEGDSGRVFKSTNSGSNWNLISKINLTQGMFLRTLTFSDENNGFTGGISDYIYRTTNGGYNWTGVFVLSNLKVQKLIFVNQNTGWAACSGSRIFKTTNAGLNWFSQNSNLIYDTYLNDAGFINENTGYICGSADIILKTTNAGENWFKVVSATKNHSFFSLQFFNEKTGWVAGASGAILKTTNGGGTVSVLNDITYEPSEFRIFRNFPNPFNSETKICFEIPRSDYISISIFDATGKKIQDIYTGYIKPGKYEKVWNAYSFSSGIYFCKLNSKKHSSTIKLILLK